MPNRPRKNNFFLLLWFSIFFSGCATIYNPATQSNETLFISTPQEVNLGRDMDARLQRELKILHEPTMQTMLDNIGAKLAATSDRHDITYYFRIVQDKELNAFSLPGGFIYVNSALMEVSGDDELAAVLGHEIGHVAARHSVKKLQADLGYQLVLSIALGISGQQDMARAMDIVFNLGSLGYGRQDELLADKLAIRYSRRAGFNPYGLITFFEKLKKESQSKGQNFKLVFLSSHPPIQERINQAYAEIARNP